MFFSTFCVKIELVVILQLLEQEISSDHFNTSAPDIPTSVYFVSETVF